MASINQVPEVLNDFRVYEEGSDNCLGVAKVELPSESVMTQTVKGVGIAGEVEARGAIQCWDSGKDKYVIVPTRAVIRGRAKSKENGTYESGNTIDATNTIETTYLKLEQNGKVVREIDKYAYKDSISDGTDFLGDVRAALGI